MISAEVREVRSVIQLGKRQTEERNRSQYSKVQANMSAEPAATVGSEEFLQ